MALKKRKAAVAKKAADEVSNKVGGRFVISNRRAGRDESARKQSREDLDTLFSASLARSVDVLGDSADFPDDEDDARRVIVIEGNVDEVASKANELGADVIIEPEYLRHTLDFNAADIGLRNTIPLPAGSGRAVEARITSRGEPVQGVGLILVLASTTTPAATVVQNISGADGKASLPYDGAVWFAKMLVVEPKSGYWTFIVNLPPDAITVELTELPQSGPLGWWQALVGNPAYSEARGQGIRVGVIDTGVGPHPYLSHVTRIGAFIGGTYDPSPDATNDVENHGTHVSGIIGARPVVGSRDFGGIAAGTDLFVARVFQAGHGANQGDIASAIEAMSGTHAVDLINLSLGGPYSEIDLDAVLVALQQGTLCICAAGNNSGGPVLYPAAYQQTVAVSGLGAPGTSPAGSTSSYNIPTAPDKFGTGGVFLASFSNIGPQISVGAPGNAIISTVPVWNDDPAPYLAMDGTSMASPAATAAAAVRLSQDPAYLALPRNVERAGYAFRSLLSGAVSLGLAVTYQGAGLARV
jgi:subtilisin family serine protease